MGEERGKGGEERNGEGWEEGRRGEAVCACTSQVDMLQE